MFTPSKALLGVALALTSGAVLADEFFDGEFEFSVAAGISSLDQDGSFDLTTEETDSLVQGDQNWDSWTANVGVGYVFPLGEPVEDDELQWFPDVTPELNLYYLGGGDINGDVHRFENPEKNQEDYTMKYHSTRLMFDVDLSVAAMYDFSIYAIGGLGISWNDTDLSVTPHPDEMLHGFDLEGSDSTTFAYEFGGGIEYTITDDIGIYLEYLYANMGNVEIAGEAPVNGIPNLYYDIDGSDVTISSQSILLGLNFSI